MPPIKWNWVYAAFWIFVLGMIAWQFINYNHSIDRKLADAGPKQEHFYFNKDSLNTATLAPAPKPDAADVRQVGFTSENNVPAAGSFTCHVTLKNQGTLKAVDVQVTVTPFRGAIQGDPDGGRGAPRALDTNDPAALLSETVVFPDLAPGESVTKDVTFIMRQGYNPGSNPNPSIIFHAEKPTPNNPSPVPPPIPPPTR